VADGARGLDGLFLVKQVAQCRARQHVLDSILRALEEAAQGTAAGVLAIRFVHSASLKNDFALDRLDDFKNGNIRGTFEQRKPAVGTANGTDQPSLCQVLEYLGQETPGDAFLAADLIDHSVLARVAAGQVHQAQNSIFACACNLHRATCLKNIGRPAQYVNLSFAFKTRHHSRDQAFLVG
jgi:hypothetical protein